jgi:2,5-diamino-6-(ribosylamino)-4(3H)-pyrimidinone 5'-phosphate reductase
MIRPYVQINVAMTADGKIDSFERAGAVISSPGDKERVDRLRAATDAVLVGGRTMLLEDPKLTVRSAALRAERMARGLPENPARVGVATIAALKPDSQFVTLPPARVVIFTTVRTSKQQLQDLAGRGVELFVHQESRVNMEHMMQTLAEIGIRRLMVEGGGTINFELLRRGLVDELSVFVAPKVFGGASSPTLADGPGLPANAAVRLEMTEIERLDDGLVLHYRLR